MWASTRAWVAVVVLALALSLPLAGTPLEAAAAPFSANALVSDDPAGTRSAPSMATYDGDLYVAWQDRRDGDFDIHFARSTNAGTTFGPNVQVNDAFPGEAANQLWPAVAVLNGVVYVVWEDWRDGGPNLYWARSLNGGRTFSADQRVDPAGSDDGRPSLAVDPARGWVLVAWDHANAEIRAARSVGGGPFSPPAVVSGAPGIEKRYPDVAVGVGGKVHVAWADGRSGTIQGPFGPEPDFDIFTAASVDGLAWEPDARLSDRPPGTVQTFPSIAVDASGRVHAAWQDDVGGRRTIRYARGDGAGVFEPSVPVLPTPAYGPYATADQQTPSLAWDEDAQTVHVAWADTAGGNMNIRAASKVGDGSFQPAVTRGGGNRFLDVPRGMPAALNGVWDADEVVLLDDGNGLLDPGVLDGVGSPDAVVAAGAANLAEDLVGQVLTYNDRGDDGQWDRGTDDIILDEAPVLYPHVEFTGISSWDTTSGNAPSYLRWDTRHGDYLNYTVGPQEVMSVGWVYVDGAKDIGVNPENFGLKDGDPISNVTMEMSYVAPAGFPSTPLNFSYGMGANATVAVLPPTGGAEVVRFFDLHALGVDTVPELRDLNVSFHNPDPALTVSFNRMGLIIHRGFPGTFDVYDTLLSGNGDSLQGEALQPLDDGDDVMYLDASLNGRYDRGEVLLVTAQDTPPGGNLTAAEDVLPRADGPGWIQFLSPFPINDDVGDGGQFAPAVAAGAGEVAVAWQDFRGGGPAIYAATTAVDARPPEVLRPFWDGTANVSTVAALTLGFREPVDPASVVVSLDPSWPFTASWDASGRELTLIPDLPWLSNTTFTVTVSAAVDLAGNPLSAPASFTFTTAVAPTIAHVPPASLEAGEALLLRADVSDDQGVDGVLVQVIQPGEASTETFTLGLETGDARAGTWRVDVAVTPRPGSLRYVLVATDVEGNLALSPAQGFHNVTMQDGTPPAIGHTPLRTTTGGSTLTLRATATDASGVVRVTLRVRPPGATEYGPAIPMEGTGDVYEAAVRMPSASGTLAYYLEAEDGFGNVAAYPAGGASEPLTVSVSPGPSGDLFLVALILVLLLAVPLGAIRWVRRPGEAARTVEASRERLARLQDAYADGHIPEAVYEANLERFAGPPVKEK